MCNDSARWWALWKTGTHAAVKGETCALSGYCYPEISTEFLQIFSFFNERQESVKVLLALTWGYVLSGVCHK
jgi:hypothetical protein